MKTLIIHYFPRQNKSRTKQLLTQTIKHSQLKTSKTIQTLDLTKNPPDFFNTTNIKTYYKRNLHNKKITQQEKNSIKNMDKLVTQFQKSELIILSFPRYNFSAPAIIKAYFDAILQKGQTWNSTKLKYKGLSTNKKILVLTTSGGIYTKLLFTKKMDILTPLLKTLFKFIGIKKYKIIDAQGLDIFPNKIKKTINKKAKKASKFINKQLS